MLLLRFQAGKECYGMDVSRIIEVIPMVLFRPLPHADPAVAGVFNYRGTITPVIDLTTLITGDASRPLFSTRVILVHYPGLDGDDHNLGLLAERVTETVYCTEEDFQATGISIDTAPYIGDLLSNADGGTIQRVDVKQLLPPALMESLFRSALEA